MKGMKLEMEEKKKSGCGIFFVFILFVFLAIIIGITVLYSMNPIKFEQQLADVQVKIEDYINKRYNFKPVYEENLIMPEVEGLAEAQRYYYFQQLSETAKKIYVTIEDSVEKMKNGEENIPLPASLNEVAISEGKEKVAEEFQNAWDAFITDKSEYYFLDSGKVCLVTKSITKGNDVKYEFFIGKGENITYFIDEYTSKEQVETALKEIELAKKEILNNTTGNNLDKILYVHDWMLDNISYDSTEGSKKTNIYTALIEKNTICEGYARLFKYIMDELEIPCVIVSGTATDTNGKTERHAWNYVYINNNWYAIDVTWDDPIIIGTGKVTADIKYKYFLKGETTISKDHKISGQITKNGKKFSVPELSLLDF